MTPIELPAAKKVKHLTLLREPRAITPKEFNALAPEERLEMIRRAQGPQKFRLLLEAADVETLVPQLPAQELYLLIRELGFDETADLIPMVDSEQLTAFIDLDCWRGDQLDGPATLPWLQALLEGTEEQVLHCAQEIDFELLVLFLQKHLQVTSGPESIDDDDARGEALRRDGGYQIVYRDTERGKQVELFLDLLLRHDIAFFRELVEAARWEPAAELEENVYQLRRGRLQDLGFPDPEAAAGVFAWLDPDQFAPPREAKRAFASGEERAAAPGFFLAAGGPKGLLAEALAEGIDESTAWELAYLVNKVMAAERVDVGEIREVRAATEAVYYNLNLALEELAWGDPAKAGGLLGSRYLEELFRLGFSLTLRLQSRARALAGSAIGPYLDAPSRALITGLLRSRPALFEGLDRPDRGGHRPFAGRRDLESAASGLTGLELQRALFEGTLPFSLPAPADLDLSGCLPAAATDLTLADFFLTALGNRLLGRPFAPTPLPRRELEQLQGLVCRGGHLQPALRRETTAWLESLLPGAGIFGESCLDLWEEEFCALSVAELDPRYLRGLLVRLAAEESTPPRS